MWGQFHNIGENIICERRHFCLMASSKHFLLLLLLLMYNPKISICIGVKAPSASAATSLSMASSLFNSMSMHPENDDPINGEDENHKTPEECKVKNLKQQQRMTMAKLDAHRCLIRDTVVTVPVPDTIIANFVHPSHVVVPRCTGKTKLILNCYVSEDEGHRNSNDNIFIFVLNSGCEYAIRRRKSNFTDQTIAIVFLTFTFAYFCHATRLFQNSC